MNNAGITRDMLAMRLKDDDWDAVIDTNLKGRVPVPAARPSNPDEAALCRIINIPPVWWVLPGQPGQANYAAAKAGVAGMTRALVSWSSQGHHRQLCSSRLHPDRHDRQPARRAAKSLECPDSAGPHGQACRHRTPLAYLASEGAGYVTGQELHVNGGMYM